MKVHWKVYKKFLKILLKPHLQVLQQEVPRQLEVWWDLLPYP